MPLQLLRLSRLDLEIRSGRTTGIAAQQHRVCARALCSPAHRHMEPEPEKEPEPQPSGGGWGWGGFGAVTSALGDVAEGAVLLGSVMGVGAQ